MKGTELLRLVWLNINQNRFKSIMTSIGIVVGAATIVMVIGIGRGGQMDIAEQFAELNAGAIDVSYDYQGEEENTKDSFSLGSIGNFFGNMMGGMFGGGNRQKSGSENTAGGSMENGSQARTFSREQMPGADAGGEIPAPDGSVPNMSRKGTWDENTISKGNAPAEENSSQNSAETERTDSESEASEEETSMVDSRLNQEQIILSADDVEDIETYISGINGATISYTAKSSVEGGNLISAQTYSVAGVKENFDILSKLQMEQGYFLEDADDQAKSRVCVLGSTVANELFGSSVDAVNSTIYIDDRSYKVIGILLASGTVSSGISPDTSIFVPYQTGIKYITGERIDPTITVIAEDVNTLQSVISNVKTVLTENYPNASFTFADSGSKMKAAEASNNTLTMLLSAMAAIVFLVGGIGIMNVLFVSVKERTNEIGILKAIGTPQSNIMLEFLAEAAAISLIGGILGVILSFAVTPVVTHFDIRVEVNLFACLLALGFAVLTGTVFGIYPAWKASRLEPVDALSAE